MTYEDYARALNRARYLHQARRCLRLARLVRLACEADGYFGPYSRELYASAVAEAREYREMIAR